MLPAASYVGIARVVQTEFVMPVISFTLIRRASLVEFPCAIDVDVLFECLPVASSIQSPLLLKRATVDRRLSTVKCSVFLIDLKEHRQINSVAN